MNSVRDLPLAIKEQDSLNDEAGLTATVNWREQAMTKRYAALGSAMCCD
jgi:hypothetical protein